VRSPRCLTAVALLAALALSACGGGNTGTGPAGEPTASAPEATAPPTDATQPGTTAVTPPTTTAQPRTEAPEKGNGGAGADAGGGEQRIRVPASFTVAPGGRLTPPTITVPPFLAVEISIRAADGRPHRLVLQTAPPHALRVAAGKRAALGIPGLRAGRYPVMLDGRRAGALVAGGEVGP
jgi:hypothetical protein